MKAHHRPSDRQTLTAAVTCKRRQDKCRIITRTRRQTRQLHAGSAQPHPRPLTTSRMTARWATKETNQRPTDRRTSTEATSSATRRDRSKHHRTDPTRRQRIACGGDDPAACSAVHSHMFGDSRFVYTPSHRCPRSLSDLAVVSPSSRRHVRRRGSCTVRCSFLDSRIRVTSNLATLLSHTLSLSWCPTCVPRSRHTDSTTACRSTSSPRPCGSR